MKIVKIYTDGACSGNPGPGGWSVVVNLEKECKQYSGGEVNTTNNRMELTAVIQCFKRVLKNGNKNVQFEVYSDSAYVVNAINNQWIQSWATNGWKTKTKEPVKNQDLWEQTLICLDAIKDAGIKVRLVKIKGHAGNTFNELCDKLAKEAAERVQTGK